MSDLDRIRTELRALADVDLYARTVEIIKIGRSGMDLDGNLQPVDRLWRRECWQEWIRREKVERFTEALAAVRAELMAERAANRR